MKSSMQQVVVGTGESNPAILKLSWSGGRRISPWVGLLENGKDHHDKRCSKTYEVFLEHLGITFKKNNCLVNCLFNKM